MTSDTPARPAPCRNLRWKTASRESGDPDELRASMQRQTVPFSCLATCQPWGPDDDLVSPEDCCEPTRGCYEEPPAP